MMFTPGNKLGKNGRPKGSPNKNLREHAITGLTRGGANKAKKAGKNVQTNGLTYFFEDLAEKNPVAAATLAGKLIAVEEKAQDTGAAGDFTPGVTLNIISAAQGMQYAPGMKVLLPLDKVEKCWHAYRAGPDVWKDYLQTIKGALTSEAYENLAAEEAPEVHPDGKVVPLRQLEAPSLQIEHGAPIDQASEPQTNPQLTALEAKLLAMDHDQLLQLAEALNVGR